MRKCDFVLPHGCCFVNLLSLFRTSFPKKSSRGLLLNIFLILHWDLLQRHIFRTLSRIEPFWKKVLKICQDSQGTSQLMFDQEK